MRHGGQSRQARQWCLDHWTGVCPKCGREISPHEPWHAGHQVADVYGGDHASHNYQAEHAKCNTSDGGRIAQQRRSRRQQVERRTRPGFWTSKRRAA